MNYRQFVLAAGTLAGGLVLGAVGLSSAAPPVPASATSLIPTGNTDPKSSPKSAKAIATLESLTQLLAPAATPQPSANPPAEIPVRFSCSVVSADLDRLGRCSVDIPSGKQLVIKSYSVDTSFFDDSRFIDDSMVYLFVADHGPQGQSARFFLPTPQSSLRGYTAGSALTHIVVKGGGFEVPWLGLITDSRAAQANAVFFGYFVDAPAES